MENPSIKGKQNYLIQLIIYSCALEETNVEAQDACLSQSFVKEVSLLVQTFVFKGSFKRRISLSSTCL